MPEFIVIAGINGTGKSSLRGVLGEYKNLGCVMIESDCEMDDCIRNSVTFTQETTLSGGRIVREMASARALGYRITMFYVGLESLGESLTRIANRVQKGGHGIPEEHVIRRYERRVGDFEKCVPYCDEIVFYDNQNGFIKVAEYRKDAGFRYTNGHRPRWLEPLRAVLRADTLQ